MKLKLVKIGLIVILIILGINTTRLIYCEKNNKIIDFKEINNEVNSYDRSQGNYVLYTEGNGIKTAPFFFGKRLYLYSIDKDKKYLIKNEIGLFDSFAMDLSIQGNRIFYQKEEPKGGPSGNIEHFYLNGSSVNKRIIQCEWAYAANRSACFVTDKNGIYRVDLESGKRELFMRGEYEYFVLKDNIIYASNETGNCIDAKSLRTDQTDQYPLDEKIAPNCIEVIGNHKLAIVDAISGNLLEYNTKKKRYKIVAKIASPSDENIYECNTCKYKTGYIYCNDEKMNIIRIEMETGERIKLIDTKKLVKGNIQMAVVSYCTDYIAINVLSSGEADSNLLKQLIIFNYSGKMVKELRLTP